jgi:dTDP-glucose 4,6-dehydratase
VPRFITSCILQEPLTVHGDGSAARDFLFVEDHCEALDLLVHADASKVVGKVINLGTGRHLSVRDIACMVVRAMGVSDDCIQMIGDRPGQVFRHTCDHARASELLGWQPKTNFEEGLERTIHWYCEHRGWWQPQMWMRQIPIITASGKRELH